MYDCAMFNAVTFNIFLTMFGLVISSNIAAAHFNAGVFNFSLLIIMYVVGFPSAVICGTFNL